MSFLIERRGGEGRGTLGFGELADDLTYCARGGRNEYRFSLLWVANMAQTPEIRSLLIDRTEFSEA